MIFSPQTGFRCEFWPLRYQILFPFAGLMLLVLAAVSLLNALLAARNASQQTVHQLREVARTLAEANFPLTDTVLAQTHGLSGAHFVLAQSDGRVLAASLDEAVIPPRLPKERPAGNS